MIVINYCVCLVYDKHHVFWLEPNPGFNHKKQLEASKRWFELHSRPKMAISRVCYTATKWEGHPSNLHSLHCEIYCALICCALPIPAAGGKSGISNLKPLLPVSDHSSKTPSFPVSDHSSKTPSFPVSDHSSKPPSSGPPHLRETNLGWMFPCPPHGGPRLAASLDIEHAVWPYHAIS